MRRCVAHLNRTIRTLVPYLWSKCKMRSIVRFLNKMTYKIDLFLRSICPHRWMQVVLNGYKTYACASCGKVSRDRR